MAGGDSELVLFRPRGWVGAARRVEVLVDDSAVGQLGSGERLVVKVEPGSHTVDAHLGAHDVSNTVHVDLAAGSSTSLAVTFLDPKTVPTPGTGGSWQRRSLELQRAAEGSVKPLPLSGLLRSVGGDRSKDERIVWALALLVTAVGLFFVRPINDIAGTVVAAAGAVTLVVMFFRRMLFRRDSSSHDPGR